MRALGVTFCIWLHSKAGFTEGNATPRPEIEMC